MRHALHTLGVNSAYTQSDIQNLARLLTGVHFDGVEISHRWWRSEPGHKKILGRVYSSGLGEMKRFLDDVSKSPQTANYLARKLVQHFISVEADPDQVKVVADAYLSSDGNLSAMYHAMLEHNNAWKEPLVKVKQPLEFVVSALRALGLSNKVSERDPLFHAAITQAISLSDELADTDSMVQGPSTPTNTMLSQPLNIRMTGRGRELARFVAERLNQDTRIATFSLDGWDTHIGQSNQIARAMTALDQSILALHEGLEPAVWDNTCILCATEFGRTVRENSARGTDHGTASAIIAVGGAVKGKKVYRKWLGLAPRNLYQDRDLKPTLDVRNYMAESLRPLGISKLQLTHEVFPGLGEVKRTGFLL